MIEIVEGANYRLPPQGGHPAWTIQVTRVSTTSVEVTVLKGQTRGRSSRFRFHRAKLEQFAQPVKSNVK